ncbi:MAG: reverse transcriptase, partial [Candidatus Homeothermus sp.]|nr:reverse transcriptase [Candidatus Homeothermus sp.]
MNNGNVNNNNKNNTNRVRAVAPVPVGSVSAATSSSVYDIPFSSIIEAWIDCERNKRSSNSCVRFRWHAARDLVQLWNEMRTANYKPRASMVFMVTHPVLREVWAGAFRDRVAHHWEHLRYQPILEQYFIDAGDRSMNCRKGYGSLRAIQTFSQAIYEYTEGYTRNDCYIVGGDFANFFMSADKPLIWPLLEELIAFAYDKPDLQALLYMMNKTMFHRCQDNFYRRSPESMWENLPHRK